MLHRVFPESGILIYCMRVQQLFYLGQKTSQFEKHMYAYDWGMEAKFNSLPYKKKKSVTDEDTTDVLDIDS